MKAFSLLPTVLIIGIVTMEVGLALSFIIYLANSSSYGSRLAQEALFAARAGINDGILRVIRDKSFSSPGYQMTVGRASVEVKVEKDQPTTGQDRITATATVFLRQKKFQAIISVDSNTGEVSLISFEEI